MSSPGPVHGRAALKVSPLGALRDLLRRWRHGVLRRMPATFTRADVRPLVLALLFPLAVALAGAGFQAWFADWPGWLSRTVPWLALIVLVGALFVQLRKQRAGTLYAIEALDQSMLSWHRTAEEESRRKQLDYRPIYRPLAFPRGDRLVDLTAELEELRRSFEFARQTDDESTGMTVAPNMLWPAALYIGFMTPFPPETRLIEFADDPRHQDFEYELGTVAGGSHPFAVTAICNCRIELAAVPVDPATGLSRPDSPRRAVCSEGGVHVLGMEVTGPLHWPGPSLPGVTPCCATRMMIRSTRHCDEHDVPSHYSLRFTSDGATRLLPEMNAEAGPTQVQVSGADAQLISAWLSERLLEVCRDTSHLVLLRARFTKVMGLALGAHLRGHATRELARSHQGAQDVWGNLLLVDHPYPDPPRLMRVHPCQPSLLSFNEEEAPDA